MESLLSILNDLIIKELMGALSISRIWIKFWTQKIEKTTILNLTAILNFWLKTMILNQNTRITSLLLYTPLVEIHITLSLFSHHNFIEHIQIFNHSHTLGY